LATFSWKTKNGRLLIDKKLIMMRLLTRERHVANPNPNWEAKTVFPIIKAASGSIIIVQVIYI